MSRPAGKVRDALEAKGMECDDGHHKMFKKILDEKIVLITRVSHGSKKTDIGDPNLKKMAAQCALTLSEFRELVDCTLDEPGWDDLVRERCKDGVNPYLGR